MGNVVIAKEIVGGAGRLCSFQSACKLRLLQPAKIKD